MLAKWLAYQRELEVVLPITWLVRRKLRQFFPSGWEGAPHKQKNTRAGMIGTDMLTL